MALDEQREDDVSTVIDGINFIVEADSDYLFDNSKIVYTKGFFGKGFNIIPAGGKRNC